MRTPKDVQDFVQCAYEFVQEVGFEEEYRVSSRFGSVLAQDTGITGSVSDATGAVLPGVTVEITGPNLDRPSIIFTGGDGAYSVSLPSGSYAVSFNLPGFALLERERVLVAEGAMTPLDVEMRIGSRAEQVSVVATGTAIDVPAINLPHAVAVVNRETLQEQGAPQLVDLFKNISASHGVIGERNSWYNSDQPATLTETIANVNLRGLGASRTLVLINGRRQTYVPARLIGGRFVDVNAIPAVAIDRIEVLKEDASATYGSDAVAGVANFVTRKNFRGFEFNVTHDHFANAGDSTVSGIWGGLLGSSHVVFAAERVHRRQLLQSDRPDWGLVNFEGGRGGWSSVGNPGAFLVPTTTGMEPPAQYEAAHLAAQGTLWDGMPGNEAGFIDPECANMGGHLEAWNCRFRYSPFDSLIDEQNHTRVFAEINGSLNDTTNYHVEGLWSEADLPDWRTTPSYPPFPLLYNGTQEVAATHPGRVAYCQDYNNPFCGSDDPWYFRGRTVGNSGPQRNLSRTARTQRLAGSIDGNINENLRYNVGLGWSGTRGNYNLPGVYTERIFLSYRGFGGPNCGVGVVADQSVAAGMRLDPATLGGKAPGQGDCMYYNPFSNAYQHPQQPGAPYFSGAGNPNHRPELANSPELLGWTNDEADLVSTTSLIVADAVLNGALVENVADFAAGYQFRHFHATGTPNRQGDIAYNPCPVIGDQTCPPEDRFGPYAFTNVNAAYDRSQPVQRLFAELALNIGPRLNTQFAANYEIHDVANSFDPKLGLRYELVQSSSFLLSLRGSLQTTFRTPSLDDTNTSPLSTLEYIEQTGAYQAVDRFGNPNLKPERAFTWNTGVVLFTTGGFEATVDYRTYDFENVIASMPYQAIINHYDQGQRGLSADQFDAYSRFIQCPDGLASDLPAAARCPASELQRVRIDLINWPGLTTSGLDTHLGINTDVGRGRFAANWDITHTLDYTTKSLTLEGLDQELQPETNAAGYVNYGNPLAVSLPTWKHRASVGYHVGNVSYTNFYNYISGYEDRGSSLWNVIEPFATWDMTFQWRFPASSFDVTLYGLNVLDTPPPFADLEAAFDGLTHNPKGRQIKLGLTCRFGAGN